MKSFREFIRAGSSAGCIRALIKIVPFIPAVWLFPTFVSGQAADTLRLTRQDAETLFLKNNLVLLAEKLHIAQAEAAVMQAKYWPNPNLEISEVNFWATAAQTGGEVVSPALPGLPWTKNRQLAVQLEQLVYTARKRKKEINLRQADQALTEQTFADMLLALKAEFRNLLSEQIFLQQTYADQVYRQRLIRELVSGQEKVFRQGNISRAELYRLKALLLSVQSEMNARHEEITASQQKLKTLLALPPATYIAVSEDVPAGYASLKQLSLNTVREYMLQHNTALKIARGSKYVSEAELIREKADRVPDLTFTINYDRNGNTMLNFVGAGVSMDLPFFNRNKGNIRKAELEVQKTELQLRHKENEVLNALEKAFLDLKKAIDLHEAIDPEFISGLNEMTGALTGSLADRNISLLQFLDYFESFRENREKYFETIKNIHIRKEELVYLAGTELTE